MLTLTQFLHGMRIDFDAGTVKIYERVPGPFGPSFKQIIQIAADKIATIDGLFSVISREITQHRERGRG